MKILSLPKTDHLSNRFILGIITVLFLLTLTNIALSKNGNHASAHATNNTYITRVELPDVDLTQITPANGGDIHIPANTVAIDILIEGAQLSTGNWGFRLKDGGGAETSGYNQGHAKFTSSTNSVSNASAWFVLGNHDNSSQDFYGSVRFFLADNTTNLWAYRGELWQVVSGSETRNFRPSGGTKSLTGTLTDLYFHGNATTAFTDGKLSIVAWVEVGAD